MATVANTETEFPLDDAPFASFDLFVGGRPTEFDHIQGRKFRFRVGADVPSGLQPVATQKGGKGKVKLRVLDRPALQFQAVAVSSSHNVVALDTQGQLWANDRDYFDRASLPLDTFLPLPISNASQVQLPHDVICALRDSKLVCHGLFQEGPTVLAHNVSSLAGDFCWIDSEQMLNCDDYFVPEALPLAAVRVRQASVNERHGCAVTEHGEIRCWGNNSYGQLGNPITAVTDFPQAVTIDMPGPWKSVVTATHDTLGHSCALKNDGALFCWGAKPVVEEEKVKAPDGFDDILRRVQYTASPYAVDKAQDSESVIAIDSWATVTASPLVRCAIDAGKLYCWGPRSLKRYPRADNMIAMPTRIGTKTDFTDIACFNHACCAIDERKDLFCSKAIFHQEFEQVIIR